MSGVACPRCPAGPWTEIGRLAAHLVEVHLLNGSAALFEARRELPPAAAPVAPLAPVASTPPKEAHVAKKKRAQQKCGTCHQPGHNAKSCTQDAAPAAPRLNTLGTPVGPIAGASNGAAADIEVKARATAREFAVEKLKEELTWAKAYVVELERMITHA